jgi:hypothetical protein
MPNIALSSATTPGSRFPASAVRTMPKASGNTPPATPCSTRPVISALSERSWAASAHTRLPTAKQPRQASSTRR